MAGPSESQVDALLSGVITSEWQKVAMVIAKAMHAASSDGVMVSEEALAARIRTLSIEGRLEVQGNLANWRRSEVRLPRRSSRGATP